MEDYGLENLVGNGEKPIINIEPFASQRVISLDDLAQIQASDLEELAQLKKEYGITCVDLADFMDYLIKEAFAHKERLYPEIRKLKSDALGRLSIYERARRVVKDRSFHPAVSEEDLTGAERLQIQRIFRDMKRNFVDGLFRVEMLRGAYFSGRWQDLDCPVHGCDYKFSGNLDVYFNSKFFIFCFN